MNIAIKATKTNNIAPTFTANFNPSVVPIAIASNMLDPIFSEETSTSALMTSVCGYNIFEITMAPGAAMTDAANKCFANNNLSTGSLPPKNPIYAARTAPATVAIPPIITKSISDLVIFSKYSLIRRGASVCPKKIFPATLKLSAPDIFNSFDNNHPKALTTFWITPK